MQSGRDDTLEERYAIKFCFKLGKMPHKRMEYFRMLFIEWHKKFKEPGSLWKMMRSVGGVRKSIQQSWLAKELGLGLRLLCWGFKGVQQGIPSERGLHSSNRVSGISTRTMHQSTTPSLSQTIWPRWASRQFFSRPDLAPSDCWLFPKLRGCRYETIEPMKEVVTKVIDTLTQEDFDGAFQKLLERYKCIATGGDYFEGD